MDDDLKPLFDGSDDDELLHLLWERIERKSARLNRPVNENQRAFFLAWEAVEILNGDGFESLCEMEFALEEYAQSFTKVGLPALGSIVDKVIALVPFEIRATESKFAHIRSVGGELDNLLREFFTASENCGPVIGEFVRRHNADFIQHQSGWPW